VELLLSPLDELLLSSAVLLLLSPVEELLLSSPVLLLLPLLLLSASAVEEEEEEEESSSRRAGPAVSRCSRDRGRCTDADGDDAAEDTLLVRQTNSTSATTSTSRGRMARVRTGVSQVGRQSNCERRVHSGVCPK
jgi:hypothetical protein